MVDITKFDTYKELMDYKSEINLKKARIEQVLSRRASLIGNWLGTEKKKIKKDKETIDKVSAIQYLEYLRDEWQKTLPDYEELQSLKEECNELNALFPPIYYFDKSVLSEYHKKTNGE